MPRPRRFRKISSKPDITYFKPAGVPINKLEIITLGLEELEAIRLKDFLLLDQKECSEKMNISQPTFHRLLIIAREKISKALVNGNAIKIEGGNYKLIK